MGDLTELQSAQAVEITDTTGSNAAKVTTSAPSASDAALAIREVERGQKVMAQSRPVVIADDQTVIPVRISTTATTGSVGEAPFTSAFKLFDFKFHGKDNTLLWYQSLSGGGSASFTSPNKLNLNVGTASGDNVIKQSQRIVGQSGVTMLYMFTINLGAKKSNVVQRAGAFDDNDGIFFEQDGTNLKAVYRSSISGSPVDTVVNQASWNVDVLDGTGRSGITLDTSLINTYFVTQNYQFLQWGVIIDGQAYYCHNKSAPNISASEIFATRNMPIRFSLTNTGTAASSTTMAVYDASSFASGGTTPYGVDRVVDLGTAGKSIGNSLTPLISVRLASTNYRNILVPQSTAMLLSASQSVLYQIIFNGSLTGASFAILPGTTPISEYDTAATAISGGDVIFSGYTSGQGQGSSGLNNLIDITSLVKLSSNIAGTSDILTLAAQKTGGTSPTGYAALFFRELV